MLEKRLDFELMHLDSVSSVPTSIYPRKTYVVMKFQVLLLKK